MKTYLCIVALFLALAVVKCEPPAEVKQLMEECEKELGLSREAIRGNHDDPKVKCFHACVAKKNGCMVDGKVSADKAIEAAAKMKDGASDSDKEEIIACASTANEQTDECEVAAAFHHCFMKIYHHKH